MAKKRYGIGSFFLDIVGVCTASVTGGASLIICPSAHALVGDVIGGVGGGGSDNTENLTKQWEIQNKQHETQLKEWKEELARLRKEREEENKKIKQNNEEIERLRLKVNDPNTSEEEKRRARSQMLVLESENRKLKDDVKKIDAKIKTKEDTPIPPPSKPWGLSMPNFSAYDKLLIGGGLTLLIYYLFLKEDKK